MQKFSSNKDINKLVHQLIKQGWRIKYGKKHHHIVNPNGRKYVIPCTPSDHRAFINFQKDIQRSLSSLKIKA